MWIGVDPGARWTAAVARSEQDEVIAMNVVDRLVIDPDSKHVTMPYLMAVDIALTEVWQRAGVDSRVAIEDVTAPIGYEFIRPSDMIGLGTVLGFLVGRWEDAVLVRPAKHGSRPFHTYPLELTTVGERRHATRANTWSRPAPKSSNIRHARSAWDVAGAAPSYEKRQKNT